MIRKFVAVAAMFAVVAASSVAQAAPVVATYDWLTGNVTFTGFTGEIGVTLYGAEGDLQKANAPILPLPGSTDTGLEGEITFANFGGFQGSLDAKTIIKPGLPEAQFALFSVQTQVDFVNRGVGTFNVINYVPEPATIAMAGMGLIGIVAARRRLVA